MARGVAIIIIIIGVMLFIAGMAIVVYAVVYKNLANKRVREFNQTGVVKKAPPSPLAVFVVLLFTLVLVFIFISLFAGISWYAITDFGSEEGIGCPIEMPDTSVTVLPAGEDDPLADITPGQDITGYTRTETRDGEYRFIYYVNDYGTSEVFPELMIYAEYTGDEGRNLYYDITCREDSYDQEQSGFIINEDSGRGWFAVSSAAFYGTLELNFSASNDDIELDVDERETASTGTLVIDYNDCFDVEEYEE